MNMKWQIREHGHDNMATCRYYCDLYIKLCRTSTLSLANSSQSFIIFTGVRIPRGSAVSGVFETFPPKTNHKYNLRMPAGGSKIAQMFHFASFFSLLFSSLCLIISNSSHTKQGTVINLEVIVYTWGATKISYFIDLYSTSWSYK